MKPIAFLLVVALFSTSLVLAPSAGATDPLVCNDRDCAVSVEMVVCVTEPCDGLVICLAHGRVCTNRL